MGRQIRFYLLPQDVGFLLGDVNANVGVELYAAKSSTVELVPVTGKMRERSTWPGWINGYERLYLARPNGPRPRREWIPKQGYWLIDPESEVIEFDGCEYGPDYFFRDAFITRGIG